MRVWKISPLKILNNVTPHNYDAHFFATLDLGSGASAARIAPWVVRVVRPTSVLDIGCGDGAWLNAFRSEGVADIFGVDGDYVDRSRLLIQPQSFIPVNLTQPFDLRRKFDLVVCLEVAEHLSPEAAATILESIVRHADVVLFSAAIPRQVGTSHLNEQWPSYWIERFATYEYQVVDIVRPQFWEDKMVSAWYRQNAMLFINKQGGYAQELLRTLSKAKSFDGRSLVHPELWKATLGAMDARVGVQAGPRELLAKLPKAMRRALTKRAFRS